MFAQEFDWERNNRIALTNSIYYALWGIKTAVEAEVQLSNVVWLLAIFLGYFGRVYWMI